MRVPAPARPQSRGSTTAPGGAHRDQGQGTATGPSALWHSQRQPHVPLPELLAEAACGHRFERWRARLGTHQGPFSTLQAACTAGMACSAGKQAELWLRSLG